MKSVMMKTLWIFFILALSLATAWATEPRTDQEIQDIVRKQLDDKTKTSGTLDIYDSESNKVRNLMMMEFTDKISQEDGLYVAHIIYRDINSGDIVTVDVPVEDKDGALNVKQLTLKKAEGPAQPSADPNKVFSDEEIQNFMKEYFESQAKVSGAVNVFDDKTNKLRKLELLNLDPQVRHFGVLHISSSEFKDKESGEKLFIDVTVENDKGRLNVQTLRIRKVAKPPKTQSS